MLRYCFSQHTQTSRNNNNISTPYYTLLYHYNTRSRDRRGVIVRLLHASVGAASRAEEIAE